MVIQFVSESMSLSSSTNCPVCGNKRITTIAGGIELLYCKTCGLYSKDKKAFLSPIDEFHRYEKHSALVDDHYVSMMMGFVNKAILPYIKEGNAIDYGSGKTGVIKQVLETNGFNCASFDPYFDNHEEVLRNTYDLVVATEVVEHFQDVIIEWKKMVALMKPKGYMSIMTQFAKDDLSDWWYLRDSTHYHFYQERTFDYIAKNLGLIVVYTDGLSRVVFQKSSL